MILLLVLFLLAAAPAAAGPDTAQFAGMPIVAVTIENPGPVPDAEIRSLLGVSAGDLFVPGMTQRGLALLAQKREIRNVIVRGEAAEGGLRLQVEVVPELLVWAVRFRGNRSVKKGKLTSRLTTRPDAPLRDEVIQRDLEGIRELYAQEGFPAATVRFVPRPGPAEPWYQAVFEIEEGPPRLVQRVLFVNPLPLEEERALAILKLRPGHRASTARMREGCQRLLEVLRREGYPEARLGRPAFVQKDGETILRLPLEAGQRTDVRIQGLSEWSARPLREILRSHYGEPIDDRWRAKVRKKLLESLRTLGYLHGEIEVEVAQEEDRRRVVFVVDPGPVVRVREVRFIGNAALPDDRLRRYMSLVAGGFLDPPPFEHDALQRDLKVVKDYYASRGFLDAELNVAFLEVAPEGGARLGIRVNEGPQFLYGSVTYKTDGVLSPEEAAALGEVRAGQRADPGALERSRVALLAALVDRGHVNAQVSYASERDDGRQVVDSTFTVTAGPLVRIGRIVVAGNVRTKSHVILRELTFHEGDPWRPAEVTRSRQRLYRLGLFQRVRIESLSSDANREVRDVRIAVEEQDAGSVSLGLGYGTEEGVKGSGVVAYSNLWGSGRSIELRADVDQIDQFYALTFREPWLFNRRNVLRLSLIRFEEEREPFDRTSLSFQSSLDRELTEQLKGSLLYTLSHDDVTDVALGSEEDAGKMWISAVGPVLLWDSRDDPFYPRQGFFHSLQAEWALDALGSGQEYERYLGSASGYFSFGKLTLALLARGGLGLRHGEAADLPVHKRFFLGGRTTVRGFDRDSVGPKDRNGKPIGGDVMLNYKAEVRFPVVNKLNGALFWDAGNVWDRASNKGEPDYLDLRHAVGFGIRYLTPVGPLTLDVGFKLEPKTDEEPYEWHFTVGNVF